VERDRWQRWSPLAGIAFAVLFLAALGVSGSGPGDTPAEQWYADDGNRGAVFFVFFLIVGAALCLLWFLGALRGALVRAEGDPTRWTAPLLLFSIFFLPLFVWLAWVLAISLVLMVRTARVAGWRGAST
jgi:hypothetical protein